MKKIPSLFVREFENHNVSKCLNEVTPGCEWVIEGKGIATEKLDGTCCLVKDGKIYKRYDAKQGKTPPKGAIPCQPEPDPITTHWPHWVECVEGKPEDKYHLAAFQRMKYNLQLYTTLKLPDNKTFELCGPHFQSNPYNYDIDLLEQHGQRVIIDCPRTYSGIKKYLETHNIEGIVFWKDEEGSEMCKIKRTDFGFEWNSSIQKQKGENNG